nr:6745_t:CDS:2 [Entrophospora candida]
MYYKFIFINIIIIVLVFSSTSTYSALTEQDIDFACQNGTSLGCCPLLAHRIASQHHSRCATIILINNTGYNITLAASSLEDGRWVTQYDYDGDIDIDCMPHSLLGGQSEAISSVSSHFLGGIKGYLFFEINDANSSNFLISWNVPIIGSPVYSSYGLSEEMYTIKSQRSLSNTVYYVTVDSKSNWNNWNIMVLSFPFLILLCCCSGFVKDNSPREQESNSFGQQGQQFYNAFIQQGQQSYNASGQQGQQSYNAFRQQERQSYNTFGQQGQQSYNPFIQQGQQSYNPFIQQGQQEKHTSEAPVQVLVQPGFVAAEAEQSHPETVRSCIAQVPLEVMEVIAQGKQETGARLSKGLAGEITGDAEATKRKIERTKKSLRPIGI